MPRRGGNTQNREHRKHGAHRMHRRTSVARRRDRVTRRTPQRAWDRVRWLEQHFADTDMDRLIDLVVAVTGPAPAPPHRVRPVEAGRKNHPRPAQKPQKPKRPKGGSK